MFYEWIEPFLWACVQFAVIDTPGAIAYNFGSFGLAWLWNELAQEVMVFAEANPIEGFTANTENETPHHAPTDGGGSLNVDGTGGLADGMDPLAGDSHL